MPKISCELKIEFTKETQQNLGGWLSTDNKDLRSKIAEIGIHWKPMNQGKYELCEINEPNDSPKLDLIRQAILDAGFLECHTSIIPKDLRSTHFSFRYVRQFTSKDRDSAKYLRLNVRGSQRIADWKETTPNGYILQSNKRLKNSLEFGWLDLILVPYVSEKFKELLESKSFFGLEFLPAIYDKPEQAVKALYQLSSSVTLPRCLVSVKDNDGEIITDDSFTGARHWDDNGYVLPVLKYDEAELASLGDFDIAMTREKLGGLPKHYRHHYIVSQNLRGELERMKLKNLEFIPVDLVSVKSNLT